MALLVARSTEQDRNRLWRLIQLGKPTDPTRVPSQATFIYLIATALFTHTQGVDVHALRKENTPDDLTPAEKAEAYLNFTHAYMQFSGV